MQFASDIIDDLLFSGRRPGPKTLYKHACVLHILCAVRDAMAANSRITTRAIYYSDVNLFKTQRWSDYCVAWLCRSLRVPRESLNVVAVPKGLVRGPMRMKEAQGKWVSCRSSLETRGCLVLPNLAVVDLSGVDFFLVLEKETVFSRLEASGFTERGVLMTARGFPDRASQRLVSLVARSSDIPL
ncbi:MAG: hypothetical protein KVP17_002128 [Porospora cf. gigantea B]|uniref:uncharacterized protein n=1 Tax=Porospora cf. gigantea B TaxID=2853592 RepID=UPI003571B11B|nr:MAG: hypothetical protein KVP17_002128 [Porospora cf. gigantea B]